jgi:hypothetical protein
MQNPFKVGEPVLTKLKTKEVEAVITQVWKNEVQVRTVDGDLLWRTMYTVWRRGEAPLSRQTQTTSPPVQTEEASAGVATETDRTNRTQPRRTKAGKRSASRSRHRKRR